MGDRSRMRICVRGVAGAMMALAMTMAFVLPARANMPPLFGTREIRSDDLKPFQKWLGALEKYAAERLQIDTGCVPGALERCRLQTWKSFLERTAALDKRAQVEAVNRFMNEHAYVLDIVNWGVEDYWESPKELLDRNGDCEDYAIAKFISLRLLGFDNQDMRIVVLQDLNLRILHAILVVQLGEQTLVLDNQIKSVVPIERIRHYKPVYSINERFWWLHRPVPGT